MSKLFNKLKPFYHIFQMKTGLILKIEYIFIIFQSAIDYTFHLMIKNTKRSLQKIIINKFQFRIFNTKYGKFKLLLTIDEIFQGLHSIKRESYVEFEKYINRGNIVCDVGAHIGTHTLKMADIVGNKGLVIALEPNLKNFGMLSLNISYNKFSNYVRLIDSALAANCGKKKLYNLGHSMYYSLARKAEKFDEVDAINFDNLFKVARVNFIDFMKMDIEGAEEEVILSETQTFENKLIKVLYIDHHSDVNYNSIIAHLNKYNYHYQKINGGHLFSLRSIK